MRLFFNRVPSSHMSGGLLATVVSTYLLTKQSGTITHQGQPGEPEPTTQNTGGSQLFSPMESRHYNSIIMNRVYTYLFMCVFGSKKYLVSLGREHEPKKKLKCVDFYQTENNIIIFYF